MEPDIHKILSNKIRMAEGKAIEWNKGLVWNKVQAEVSVKKKSILWYWSAAAAISVLVILYTIYRIEPREAVLPIARTEDPVEKTSTENLNSTKHFTLEDDENPPSIIQNTPGIQSSRKMPIAIVTGEDQEHQTEKLSAREDVALIDDIIINEEMIVENEVIIIAQEKIEPIIGVYYPQERHFTDTKRTRKTRLLKDEAEESKPWDGPSRNRIMLARNK
jgi:hypothetical protein